MGQQQLLLLVLGIVIAGLAVVIAISMFGDKANEADYDAIISEAMRVSGNILSWKYMPSVLGGGSNAQYLTGLKFDAIGYKSTNAQGTRANSGRYLRSLSQLSTPLPYITVIPASNQDLRVQLYMYGPATNCYKLRRSRRVNGEWENADIKVGAADKPASCIPWKG